MSGYSYSTTISLLALILAAFATLATVYSAANGGTAKIQAVRLRSVLSTSFSALIVGLIPGPLLQLGLADDMAWRVAAGLAVLVTAASSAFGLRTARLARTIDETKGWVVTSSLMLTGAAFGSLLLAMVADQPVFWYGAALLLIFLICTLNTIRLLFSLPVFDTLRD